MTIELTSAQILMLKAALLSGESALSAWDAWQSQFDLEAEHLDAGNYSLLPRLYRNLESHGVDDPLMGRLKGIYRRTWYTNQKKLHRLKTLLVEFSANRIPMLLMGDVPLIMDGRQDVGLWPLLECGVLVGIERSREAWSILARGGFYPESPVSEMRMDTMLNLCCGWILMHEDGTRIALRWRLFPASAPSKADSDLWKRALPLLWEKIEARRLSPSDQLLMLCAQGQEPNVSAAPCRLARAWDVLCENVDWTSFLYQTEHEGYILAAKEILSWLNRELKAPVPESVLERLAILPVSKTERIAVCLHCPQSSVLRKILAHWVLIWRRLRRQGCFLASLRALLMLPGYLQITYGQESLGRLLSRGFGRLVKGICGGHTA